jgi:predicted Fe-S protein YdhL (DUF1289 family)
MKKSDRPEKSSEVKSPCIRKCSLGQDKVCPACHRTLDEIVAWPGADNEMRTRILEAVKRRKA